MTAPISPEVSQFSRTTFLEPAICRPRQDLTPPPINTRLIWRNEDPQEYIKVPSIDPAPFESNFFGGRSYSSSFVRSSAGHHSDNQCLPPPLTEPPSPRQYFGFGSIPSYPETPQYHLTPTDPHPSSGSPTFPLRPSDDWSLSRTSSLSSSQSSFWGPNHSIPTGVPELSHRRSYSTISSDAVSTTTRETDSQISPVTPEVSWDRQRIEVPLPEFGHHDPFQKPREPTISWINGKGKGASQARRPADKVKSRTPQACNPCRVRKAKCDGKFPCERCVDKVVDCVFSPERGMRGPSKKSRNRGRRPEEDPLRARG